jgi:hypothetical protein
MDPFLHKCHTVVKINKKIKLLTCMNTIKYYLHLFVKTSNNLSTTVTQKLKIITVVVDTLLEV